MAVRRRRQITVEVIGRPGKFYFVLIFQNTLQL